MTVPATDPCGQAQVLQSPCNGNSTASCKVKATSAPMNTSGLKHHPVVPRSESPATSLGCQPPSRFSDAQAVANSIGVSVRASVKVFQLVSVELTGTYPTTVAPTHTFTQAVLSGTAPFRVANHCRTTRSQRDGRFTSWATRKGVTVEYPDPNGQSVDTTVSTPIAAAAPTLLGQTSGDTMAAGV